MSVRVLSGDDVRIALQMPDCIEAMDTVLRELAAGELYLPLRSVVRPPQSPGFAESPAGSIPVASSIPPSSGRASVCWRELSRWRKKKRKAKSENDVALRLPELAGRRNEIPNMPSSCRAI